MFDIIMPQQLRCSKASSTPVYGSFWRWLFRRPKYFVVEFEYHYESSTNGTNASNPIDNA